MRQDSKMPTTMPTSAQPTLLETLTLVRRNRLVRQNVVLFAGGLAAGAGSFVYHAIAGRILGPAAYGQVASLIAAYAIGLTIAVILSLVLARHTATLIAGGESGIGSLLMRTAAVMAIPCLAIVLITALIARSVAAFEHLASSVPVLILGLAIALGWQLAIPRGILQGLQRFKPLAVNLALDPIVRVSALLALLAGGYAVFGAMAAVVAGLVVALGVGIYSLRDRLGGTHAVVRLRLVAGFSLTAAAGVVGIQLLFNQDVVLAEHYLPSHQGGIYGGLNKIATIVFYLTLSVSQVLFPRVVDAIARRQHPGRLLLSSAGILSALGAAAMLLFAVVPGLVVGVLYGPAFRDATPYVLAVGVIGLALSLDNLLVQFFMAVRDYWFVPILAVGCVAEAGLIILFHAAVGQVVADILLSLLSLLVLLTVRCYLLLPTLRAVTVADPGRLVS
jgi:O-antigen/teichoic acid export membrane protein